MNSRQLDIMQIGRSLSIAQSCIEIEKQREIHVVLLFPTTE